MSMNKRDVKLKKNSNSGHGALGMGGQPTDDPRDINSGGHGVDKEDRTVKVPGAFGQSPETEQGEKPES